MDISPLYIAKFWMKVKIDETSKELRDDKNWYGKCWTWQGSCFVSGYGRFSIHQKVHRAHRISYYLYNGRIAKENLICHKCDNPKCVNPLHLFEGSSKDNTHDMIKKGRQKKKGKHKHSSSKYHGVYFRKEKLLRPWRVIISHNYKQYRIGEFDTEYEAAKAFDYAIIKRKINHPLNFPDDYDSPQ